MQIQLNHCVQSPSKTISPDHNSDEDCGIAASLLITIKGAYCIKSFDLFILPSKTSQCIMEEVNKYTKKTSVKTGK